MLRVTAEEHRLNFRTLKNHKDALDNASATNSNVKDSVSLLLTFYSVEVGLKYLLNFQEKIPFKHEKPQGSSDYVEKYSHNLNLIISTLKIPASRLPSPPAGPFICSNQNFNLEQSHEAFRYGLSVTASDQIIIKEYMEKVTEYLMQEIPE
ncbi:hypothetical protein [uncultured Pantoea sp.]|uniref:hypothetical protein n=1 Tax=uncultured Pantoea sp. TaxID=218084 RepID=UPI0025850529|nr:hypothetical protein [uncultured Pantoea sp.]